VGRPHLFQIRFFISLFPLFPLRSEWRKRRGDLIIPNLFPFSFHFSFPLRPLPRR
jgi:hypothetical protein